MKRFSVITLFPEFFEAFKEHSVLGRGVREGLLSVELVNPRKWGLGAYASVDDYSYGGKGGMTLRPEPLAQAVDSLGSPKPFVIYPSPQGVPLTQDLVEGLYQQEHIALLCGHYEGLDERFVEEYVDLEVSLGDFVLTGGELPAMTIIDAVSRLVPGLVGNFASVSGDSFYDGLLDTCHYTRPEEWRGKNVPPVLLSGDEGAIDRWRSDQSLSRTLTRRPDLLSRAGLANCLPGPVHLGLVMDEPLSGEEFATLVGLLKPYNLGRLFVAPSEGSKEAEGQLKTRLEELGLPQIKTFRQVGHMIRLLEKKTGQKPLVITLEEDQGLPWLEVKRQLASWKGPVLFLQGDGCKGNLSLKKQGVIDGELPLVALISTTMDRFFGSRN